MAASLLSAALILGVLPRFSSTAHILAVPLPFRSHALAMMQITTELHKQYGHTTTMILPEYFVDSSFVRGYGQKYVIAKKYNEIKLDGMEQNMTNSGFKGEALWLEILTTELPKLCGLLLTDAELYNKISQEKYDLAIIDNFVNAPCVSILAYKLSVPYIHLGRTIDVINSRIPISVSSMPTSVFFQFSAPMTFRDRFINTLAYLLFSSVPDIFNPKDAVDKYAPEKPRLEMSDMRANVQLHLVDYDVLLDWPLPFLTNFIAIGGLTTKKPDPLAGELAKFMDQAKKGAIIVSFGSLAEKIPAHVIEKLKSTFKQLSTISFVVKIKNFTFEEKNVFSLPWIPQNDLLGHKNTKVFVTHCGNRGQFEALYNAIPMIGLPLHSDQPYNARRMEIKGYGIPLDIGKFTSTDLINAIKEVTENPKYKQKIKQASEIFKHHPQTPIQRAVFWVEHVIRYGGHHMRTYSHDIPYYQYILLDVYAVILSILTVVFVTIYLILKKILQCCRRKEKTE